MDDLGLPPYTYIYIYIWKPPCKHVSEPSQSKMWWIDCVWCVYIYIHIHISSHPKHMLNICFPCRAHAHKPLTETQADHTFGSPGYIYIYVYIYIHNLPQDIQQLSGPSVRKYRAASQALGLASTGTTWWDHRKEQTWNPRGKPIGKGWFNGELMNFIDWGDNFHRKTSLI